MHSELWPCDLAEAGENNDGLLVVLRAAHTHARPHDALRMRSPPGRDAI